MFMEYPLFSGARALSSPYKKSFWKISYISYTQHRNLLYLLAVSGEGLGVGFHFLGVGYHYFTCKTAFQSGETDRIPCKMHKETARFESVFDGVIVGSPERSVIANVSTCPVGRVPSGRVLPRVPFAMLILPWAGVLLPLAGRARANALP